MYITQAQVYELQQALHAAGFRPAGSTLSTRSYFGCKIEQVGKDWIVEGRSIYHTLKEAKAAIRNFPRVRNGLGK